jgi:hypothetical protein
MGGFFRGNYRRCRVGGRVGLAVLCPGLAGFFKYRRLWVLVVVLGRHRGLPEGFVTRLPRITSDTPPNGD